MLERGHLPTAISKLPADRSVNYLVDEVDDSSSRPFLADALSWCSTNQPARTRLRAPGWRVVHWTAGDGCLVSASRVAWPPRGSRQPNGLVESRVEPLVQTG
jgi:hypothetical protein